MPNMTIGIQLDEPRHFPRGTDILIDSRSLAVLQIPQQTKIRVKFGNLQRETRVGTGQTKAPLLRLNEQFARQLHVPGGVQLHIRYDPSAKTIHIGPILGVLVSGYYPHKKEELFGILSSFCEEVIAAARQKGVYAYIFTLNDVDHGTQTVKGWHLRNGNWKQSVSPLPTCVYNRLSSRREEKSEHIQQQLQSLKAYRIPVFNEMFLNKWHVYQALSQISEARPFIPRTELYRGYETLRLMLSQYRFVYLKPTNGSMGRGIYRVTKDGQHYVCQYSTLNGQVKKTYSSLAALLQTLSPRIAKKPYLVQQGLSLVKQNGSPVDFRCLVQKNRQGEWGITSIVARTGSANSIVSNIAQGGIMTPAKQALAPSSTWQIARYTSYAKLRQASLTIAHALEKGVPGHFAELGIDLAVDTNGKIWLLEVNSKPSKTDDTVVEEKKTPRPSVLKLLDYALYLGNYPQKQIIKRKLLYGQSPGLKQRKKKRKKR
ncbi:spore coat associated protein YheD [Bacillaceae bacterium]